jgi:hypothetical protein
MFSYLFIVSTNILFIVLKRGVFRPMAIWRYQARMRPEEKELLSDLDNMLIKFDYDPIYLLKGSDYKLNFTTMLHSMWLAFEPSWFRHIAVYLIAKEDLVMTLSRQSLTNNMKPFAFEKYMDDLQRFIDSWRKAHPILHRFVETTSQSRFSFCLKLFR